MRAGAKLEERLIGSSARMIWRQRQQPGNHANLAFHCLARDQIVQIVGVEWARRNRAPLMIERHPAPITTLGERQIVPIRGHFRPRQCQFLEQTRGARPILARGGGLQSL